MAEETDLSILEALIGHLDDEDSDDGGGAEVLRPKDSQQHRTTPAESSSSVGGFVRDLARRPANLGLASIPRVRGLTRVSFKQNGFIVSSTFRNILKPLSPAENFTENICGIPISNPMFSPKEISTTVFGNGRLNCKIENLLGVPSELANEFPKNFGLIGVISNQGPIRTSTVSRIRYQIWTISNLKGEEIKAFLFAGVFNEFSSLPAGSIIALVSPKVQFDYADVQGISLSLSIPSQVVLLGTCASFAKCRIADCFRGIDKSRSVFCKYHEGSELQVLAANRMDVNSCGSSSRLGLLLSEKEKESVNKCSSGAKPSIPVIEIPIVPKVNPKAYMGDIISKRSLEGLTPGQRKVAQALKMIDTRKPKAISSIPGIPQVQQTQISTTSSRPLQRSSTVVGAAAELGKRVKLGSGLAGQPIKTQLEMLPSPTIETPSNTITVPVSTYKRKSGRNADFLRAFGNNAN